MAGQTLAQVRGLLAEAGLHPQHRLGQNFLIDLNLMRKVVATAEVGAADVVLEVGPGTGSLTELLLDTGARVISVELDRGLAALNRRRLGGESRFTLVEGDALAGKNALSPDLLAALREHGPNAGGARKLVANLPYQIATPLMMELLYAEPRLAKLTCTIQKEVGERLTAAAGTSAYGPLSIVVQTLATVEIVATLPPKAFWPAPKVDSVLVHIVPLSEPPLAGAALRHFVSTVRDAFTRRRKMLRRIARDWPVENGAAVLAAAEVSPDCRPEALSPPHWRRLCDVLRASGG